MKKALTNAFLGFWAGIGGALIFEPINEITDVLLSDYTIGGVVVGALNGFLGNRAPKLLGNLLISIGLGLLVFLGLGLLSGQLQTDLIAGGFIGLLLGLVSHFFYKNKEKANQA